MYSMRIRNQSTPKKKEKKNQNQNQNKEGVQILLFFFKQLHNQYFL